MSAFYFPSSGIVTETTIVFQRIPEINWQILCLVDGFKPVARLTFGPLAFQIRSPDCWHVNCSTKTKSGKARKTKESITTRWEMHRGESSWERLDRELERRVVNFLCQHFPRLRTIEVSASQGVVTINGRVNSFYERQLCISCCQRVAGVTSLVDKVEVTAPPAPAHRTPVFRPRIALAS